MTSPAKDTPITFPVGPATNFWWAFQSQNFRHVYPDGTLWAPLKGARGQRVASWETSDDIRPGDVILNFKSPAVQGVSLVATLPTPSCPPLRGYKEPTDTNGTLVLTDPLCEVRIFANESLIVLRRFRGWLFLRLTEQPRMHVEIGFVISGQKLLLPK